MRDYFWLKTLIAILGIYLLQNLFWREEISVPEITTFHNNVRLTTGRRCIQVDMPNQPEAHHAILDRISVKAFQAIDTKKKASFEQVALYELNKSQLLTTHAALRELSRGERVTFEGRLLHEEEIEVLGLPALESQLKFRSQGYDLVRTALNINLEGYPVTITSVEVGTSPSKRALQSIKNRLRKC